MTRIVGNRDRTEFEPDPVEALRRGKVLDAMLRGAIPPHPRGVYRLTHRAMNEMDDRRMLQAARRINVRG